MQKPLSHPCPLFSCVPPLPTLQIKNSWGGGWGESGYFKLATTAKDKRGECWRRRPRCCCCCCCCCYCCCCCSFALPYQDDWLFFGTGNTRDDPPTHPFTPMRRPTHPPVHTHAPPSPQAPAACSPPPPTPSSPPPPTQRCASLPLALLPLCCWALPMPLPSQPPQPPQPQPQLLLDLRHPGRPSMPHPPAHPTPARPTRRSPPSAAGLAGPSAPCAPPANVTWTCLACSASPGAAPPTEALMPRMQRRSVELQQLCHPA